MLNDYQTLQSHHRITILCFFDQHQNVLYICLFRKLDKLSSNFEQIEKWLCFFTWIVLPDVCLSNVTIASSFEGTDYSQGILAYFCLRIIFVCCYLKLVFLPQLSIKDTRQARKILTLKDKNLATGIK